eukprot:TRINITY_DN48697_c0_g1_i1.p1 TRINITY_DN48697_c0_g1~~TRINITY_DN48697_c0_g1_i1.p1  ORF type:complete len:2054 (-),score=493.08 TRINITY_DN48697_c0_g1_i1:257-5752(-)
MVESPALQKTPTPPSASHLPQVQGDEWKARVQSTTDNVEEVVGGAKEMVAVAKEISAGNDTETNADEVVEALRVYQETLKQTQEFVTEEMTQAKAEGPRAAAAVLVLAKLSPRLKTLNAMIGVELKKLNVSAEKSREAQNKENADKEKASKQKAVATAAAANAAVANASKDIGALILKAVELVISAEEAVESVCTLGQSLLNATEEMDVNAAETAVEVEKSCGEATKKVTDAGRATNLAIQTVRRAGNKEDNKGHLDELSGLQAKLTEAQKKLVPFKRFKVDFEVKIKAAKTLKEYSDKIVESEQSIEKVTNLIGANPGDMTSEDLSSIDSLLLKAKQGLASTLVLIQQKVAMEANIKLKEALTKLVDRTKESEKRRLGLANDVELSREAVKSTAMINQSKEKVDRAAESVLKVQEAEVPFLPGSSEIKDANELAKAVKASEDAQAKADKAIGQARGFLKQKLMDAKRLSADLSKTAVDELDALVARVDDLSKSCSNATKDTFERKYASLMSDVLGRLSEAEAKVTELHEAAEVLSSPDKLTALDVPSLKVAGEKAVAADKAATSAVQEAKKELDAKVKELKGRSSAAVSQMQSRLQVVTRDLAKYHKVATSAEKLVTSRVAMAEEENRIHDTEKEIQKITQMCSDEANITQQMAMEMETIGSEALKTLKASAKVAEEVSQSGIPSLKEAAQKLVEKSKAVQKELEDARATTRDVREKALCGAYVAELEKRLSDVEASLDRASDAELPFLSGMEVLPIDDATTTLAACDAAVADAAGLITKTRTFAAAKTLEMKKFASVGAKPAIDTVVQIQEKIKGCTDRLTRFKTDITEHRRHINLQQISESLTTAEAMVEEVGTIVKPFEEKATAVSSELTAEDASSMSKKVLEMAEKTKSTLDEIRKLLLARQKDPEKAPGEVETLKKADERFKKAQAEITRAMKVAADSEHKIAAAKMLSDVKAKATALEDELATVTSACAPLLVDAGKDFLVAASSEMVVEAFQTIMRKDDLSIETLFKKISSNKKSISQEAFVQYLCTLPEVVGREDLTFSESRRLAIFNTFDTSATGSIDLSIMKAKLLQRKFTVCKKVAITDSFLLSHGKTLAKLETGEAVEVVGETKRDESANITRVHCRVPAKDITGWITSHGNAGSLFLQPISPYNNFVQDTEKKIEATVLSAAALMAVLRTKLTEMTTVTDGTVREAKAELIRMKPKAVETQTKLEKLKRSFAAAQKEFVKAAEADKIAYLEAKERAVADAVLEPVVKEEAALTAALEKLESVSKVLLSLKSEEQMMFETPIAFQEECDGAGQAVASKVEEIHAYVKCSIEKVSSPVQSKGPLAEARKELTRLKEKADATLAKRVSTIKAVGSVCNAIATAGRGKVTKVLREDAQSKGVSLESYFDMICNGKADVSTEALCQHVGSLDELEMKPEHLKLACTAIQAGSICKRRFIEVLQSYFLVVKEIAITAEFDMSKSKPIRKAEAKELIELIDGPRVADQMTRIKGRCLKDNVEGWVTISGNKGTPFLQETVKPYYACSRDIPLQSEVDSKDGDIVRTLRSEEMLEVIEGPTKAEGFADELRARIKVPSDNTQGFVTIRDCKGAVLLDLSDKHFTVQAATPMTEEFDADAGKTVRKLAAGELVVALDDAVEVDGSNVKRINAKAAKDGVTGWVSISGAKAGTSLLAPSKKHYIVRQPVPVCKRPTGGDVSRMLDVDEVVEMLGVPKSEKVEVPVRVRGRAVTDGSVGWISVGGARPCKPFYTCRKPTPIHDGLDSSVGTVVRQLDVGEVIEMLEVPQDDTSDAKVVRFRGCAVKDGARGWMTIKDKVATYIAAANI